MMTVYYEVFNLIYGEKKTVKWYDLKNPILHTWPLNFAWHINANLNAKKRVVPSVYFWKKLLLHYDILKV